MSVTAANANEQLVLDFFEVLSSGDLEKLREFYHERSVWEPKVKDIAGAGKHIGMDIIDKFLAPVRGMFEPGDPKVHVQNLFRLVVDGETHLTFDDVAEDGTGMTMARAR